MIPTIDIKMNKVTLDEAALLAIRRALSHWVLGRYASGSLILEGDLANDIAWAFG